MFQLNHVTLNGSSRPRLDDVTVTIPPGRTAIIGYSGAGKTSLLNVLAGFERPDAGTVRGIVDERTAKEGHPAETAGLRARLPLYWVPQNGGLWPHLTVDQHLGCVWSAELSDKLLRSLNLEHRRSALPGELSLGERSRLALARALATQAEVLLLDEPLSHVDPVRKSAYWNVLREMIEMVSTVESVQESGTGEAMRTEDNPLIRPNGHLLPLEGGEGTSAKAVECTSRVSPRNGRMEHRGTSIVFTSHEPETVLRHSETVICLQAGRVVFQGTTTLLYDSPPSQEVGEFLGPLNWFDAEEASFFLVDQYCSGGSSAIRPERMILVTDADSLLELVAMPFRGGYAESVVRHSASGKTRTVLHQLTGDLPSTGQRVRLHVGDAR